MLILWTTLPNRALVQQILLPTPRVAALVNALAPQQAAAPNQHPDIRDLVERLAAFWAGEPIVFPLDKVDLGRCNPFQRRVLLAEYAIPRGSVSSYGLLAQHIGAPGAARAVGSALANNPFPIVIPCHRAIRSDGQLGGYQGGLAMKRSLLKMEGADINATGRVVNPNWHYLG
jgi:methylated-DNA-[protein]-cysteine S-methyltransferase